MSWKLGLVLALTLAGGQTQALAAQAAEYYEDALVRFEHGDLEGAAVQLKNALQQQPSYLAAQLLLGRLYLAQGKFELAETSLQAATRLGADRAEVELLRARALLAQGKFQALLDEIKPEGLPAAAQAQVHAYRGQALLEQGQLFEAEQAFAAAQANAPQSAVGYTGMAMLRLREHKFGEAQREAERAVELGARDADAWNVWAAVRHEAGDADKALQGYDYALSLEPRHLAARLAKLGLLLDLGRVDAMEADLAYVRQQFAYDPRGMLLNAQWLGRRGEAAAAQAQMREAGDLLKTVKPDDLARLPQLLLVSGVVHYALGEFERARDDLSRFLERTADHAGARRLLGTVYLQLGEPRQALSVLEPARRQAGEDYRLLGLLGIAHMRVGNHLLATQLLEQAAELSGGAPGIVTELANLRFQRGQRAQALDELGAVFDKDPNQFRAGMLLMTLQLRSGRAADAVKVSERLIALEPDNLTLLNLRAMAQLGSGDATAARATLERALAVDPGFVTAHVNLAKLELAQGQTEQAIARLSGQLAAYPGNGVLMYELGRVYAAADRLDEAALWWEKARSVDAAALAPRLALAELYRQRQAPAKALALAEEAVQRAPEDLAALAALGQLQLAAGQREPAQVTFRRLAKFAGVDPDRLLGVARLQLRAGVPADAAQSLEQAERADPRREDVLVALIEAYQAVGRFDQAEERARALLAAHPGEAVVHGVLGDVLLRRGRFQEAAQVYQQGLALKPGVGLALGAYRALLGGGDGPRAIALLEGWLKDHPDDRLAQMALGEGYVLAGEWRRAQPLYETLVAARPDDAVLLNNLAYIYLQTGDPRALDTARRALERAPEDAAALDTLGWVLVQRGEPAQGLAHLREAQSRASTNPEVRYHLGVALAGLGRQAEARRQLEQALVNAATFPGADEARKLLETLPR